MATDKLSSENVIIELMHNSYDPDKGEGDILTTPSEDAFISENGEIKIEDFLMIIAVRTEEQTQKMFCLLADNTGIGHFMQNEVGVTITTIDGTDIDFTSFGTFEINDIHVTGFAPIDLENPDIDILFDDGIMGVTSPQKGIDDKWDILATTPITAMIVKGAEGVHKFIPNPDYKDFPAQNLFIEHLKAISSVM